MKDKRILIWFLPAIMMLIIVASYAVLTDGRFAQAKTGKNKVSGNEVVVTGNTMDTVSDNAVSGNDVSGDAVSDNAVSGNTVSDNTVSSNTVSGDEAASKPQIKLSRPVVSAIAKDDFTVLLTWDKVEKANSYMVYRCRTKDGRYKCIGVTDKKKFTDTDVKRAVTYYYVVCAVRVDKKTGDILSQSRYSKICHVNIYMNPPKVSVTDVSASHVTLKFTRSKNAQVSNIYRSTKPDGEFYKVGYTTEKTFTDTKVDSNTTYYYKVLGKCINKDGRTVWSLNSNIVETTTKTVYNKTVYVGDSIIHGIMDYGFVTSSSTNEKVIAKVGVGTKSFYESELMDSLKKVGTARVFIMLGINSLWSEDAIPGIIKYYKLIVEDLKAASPDADIVCLSLAPTASTAKIKNSNVNKFNKALEEMAKECGVSYFDFTSILKDSNGYLMDSRAGYDGIHWTKSTYDDVVAILREY
ncbi:MAG: hypothetical protein IKQ56_04035 [Lachnospiraceae bacterium]|nr:hypothetical protein [Lachnospiraceae bacterium]